MKAKFEHYLSRSEKKGPEKIAAEITFIFTSLSYIHGWIKFSQK